MAEFHCAPLVRNKINSGKVSMPWAKPVVTHHWSEPVISDILRTWKVSWFCILLPFPRERRQLVRSGGLSETLYFSAGGDFRCGGRKRPQQSCCSVRGREVRFSGWWRWERLVHLLRWTVLRCFPTHYLSPMKLAIVRSQCWPCRSLHLTTSFPGEISVKS